MLYLALTVCFAAVSAFGEDVIREESIAVTPAAGDIVAISNINGSISVEGRDSDVVEVVYVITCETQEEMDAVEVLCDLSNGVVCEVEYDNNGNDDYHGEVEFRVWVPENLELSFELANVNGDASISFAEGTLLIEVVNGDISASHFNGEVNIELVNGSVTTADISKLSGVDIVNGDIICSIGEVENDIFLSSVNGEISIDLVTDAIVKIETLSGEIGVSRGFNADIEESIAGKSTSFGYGEHTIAVSTVSGDITISD